MIGKATINGRGFGIVEFVDQYGAKCSVQCSSAIGEYADSWSHPGSSYLWIGVNDADPKILASQAREYGVETDQTTGWVPYPIPEAVLLSPRMHLDREQVQDLIECLLYWLENGELQ